jgi:hypothetical protein
MEIDKPTKPENHKLQKRQSLQETTIQAHDANLATILQENKPNPWGKGHIRLYLICGLIYLCSTMNGKCFSVLIRP